MSKILQKLHKILQKLHKIPQNSYKFRSYSDITRNNEL